MKILMFGQQFPSGIPGGVEMAFNGDMKYLSKFDAANGSFITPENCVSKNKSMIKLISAIGGYVSNQNDTVNKPGQSVKSIHINSILVFYVHALEWLD